MPDVPVPEPQPIPTVPTIELVSVTDNETGQAVRLIRVSLFSLNGVHISFWDGESAQVFGKSMLEAGRQTMVVSGIVIPRATVPKDLRGNGG